MSADSPYKTPYTEISPGRYVHTYTGVEFRNCPKWDTANERWVDAKDTCNGSVAMFTPDTMAIFRICNNCL